MGDLSLFGSNLYRANFVSAPDKLDAGTSTDLVVLARVTERKVEKAAIGIGWARCVSHMVFAVASLWLAALPHAFAEDYGQPTLKGQKCQIPADPSWSPQEKFVWNNVCVGNEADFNKDPKYGNGVALDPNEPEKWPDMRILRPEFLEAILLNDKYRRVLTRLGVRITGAKFIKPIDLENAELRHDLWLDESLIEQGINFEGLRTTFAISVDGSRVLGKLTMSNLHGQGDVRLRENGHYDAIDLSYASIAGVVDLSGSTVSGDLDLRGVKASGDVDLSGAKIRGKLNMVDIGVGGGLFLREKAEFGEVDAHSARVGGQVELRGSTFSSKLDMNGLESHGRFLGEKAHLDSLNLIGAHLDNLVDLSGATIDGPLDMSRIQIKADLDLRKSDENQTELHDVDLSGAAVGGNVELSGAKIRGKLNMVDIGVGGGLFLREKAEFGEVDAHGAHVQGQVELSGSTFSGKLDMNGLESRGRFLGANARLESVNLAGAHIDNSVDLSGATIAGPLDMSGVQIKSYFLLKKSDEGQPELHDVDMSAASVSGAVDLSGAKILGKLDMVGARIENFVDLSGVTIGGPLHMSRLEVKTDLDLRKSDESQTELHEVDLSGASVGGNVNFSGARVLGRLVLTGLHAGEHLFLSDDVALADVDAHGARIDGSIDASGARVTGKMDLSSVQVGGSVILRDGANFDDQVDLFFCHIQNDIVLVDSTFHKDVDLTSAQVARNLVLGEAHYLSQGVAETTAHWSDDARLVLQNARVDAIQATPNAWPRAIELTGFVYQRLGAYSDPKAYRMSGHDADWFDAWLRRQVDYTPGPYEQLAQVLQSQGQLEKADDIRFMNKERQREEASGIRAVGMWVLDKAIGYGYGLRIWRSLIPAVIFLFIGYGVLHFTKQVDKDGRRLGLEYSLSAMLPFIELRQSYKDIELKGIIARFYFYGHRLLGFILASFFAVGLSGLTK